MYPHSFRGWSSPAGRKKTTLLRVIPTMRVEDVCKLPGMPTPICCCEPPARSRPEHAYICSGILRDILCDILPQCPLSSGARL